MTIVLGEPGVNELGDAIGVLREWQHEGAPLQLHPGDLGWLWRFGADATAAAVRTWRRDGELLAIGLLDGSDLLRLGMAPEAQQDEQLAEQLVADATDPSRGVLPEGEASVESPNVALIHDLLGEAGWAHDEPWAIARRDLVPPVEEPGVRVEVIGAESADVWARVQGSAFDNPHATDDRWHAMAVGVPHADARCLVAHDAQDHAVAAVTVWSAGPGRPGIIEPMGSRRLAPTSARSRPMPQPGSSSCRRGAIGCGAPRTDLGQRMKRLRLMVRRIERIREATIITRHPLLPPTGLICTGLIHRSWHRSAAAPPTKSLED